MSCAESSGAPKRILVIDDEKDLVDLLARLFARRGYEVSGVLSASEAEQLLNASRFDLVVSDIKLGNENGIELFRTRKRAQGEHVERFVFLSGADNLDFYEADFADEGGCTFLSKPVDFQLLLSIVNNLCR